MCTVSWIVSDRNYRLYFNRDEQRSRQRAEPPRIQEQGGIELMAPHDGPGGGSWIAVNQYGLTAFLLNNYAAAGSDPSPGYFRSRGELPMWMAQHSGLMRAIGSLENLDLSSFRPFYLGLLGPSDECRLFVWDGLQLKTCFPGTPMMTTSSFLSETVESYRKKRYLEMCGEKGCDWDKDQSLSFHRDLSHEDRAFNPLMSREDAETHCISVIEVESRRVTFNYYEDLSRERSLAPAQICSIERKGEA